MLTNDPLGLIGRIVDGKYSVEECVGEGGFGVVYRATHTLWKQPVALKCLKALMGVAPDARQTLLDGFVGEGALLTELSTRTASIVQARDVGTLTMPDGGWVPYIVLEWLDGETLEGCLEREGRRPWSAARAVAVLDQAAHALDIAHRRNVAHRDVKPANIFLVGEKGTPEPLVKVLDFGIAKVVQAAASRGFTQTSGQVTSFTPAYGAPEQFSRVHGATGPWTDVFALALVFVELVVGHAALTGDEFFQLGTQSSDPEHRPTPRPRGVELGDDVEAVLAHALAVSPAARYQTAGEFWGALRAAVGGVLPSSWSSPRPTQPGVDAREGAPAAALAATEAAPAKPLVMAALGATAPLDTATSPATGSHAEGRTHSPSALTNPSRAGASSRARVALAVIVGVTAAAVFLITRRHEQSTHSLSSAASSPAPIVSSVPGAPLNCPPKMAAVEGGKFFMGSDERGANDWPVHRVSLSPYCIDLFEATVADYKECSDKGECQRAYVSVAGDGNTARDQPAFSAACNQNDPVHKGVHPINCVDWNMARGYCAFAHKRLPTEAEWEFAARGPDGRPYPWGDQDPDASRLNACGPECVRWGAARRIALGAMYRTDDGNATTAPVGSYPSGDSRFGLHDVAGNVWEWTADFMGDYAADALQDPTGPAQGEKRVIRGGGWNSSDKAWARPSFRYSFAPDARLATVGFRCVSSGTPAP